MKSQNPDPRWPATKALLNCYNWRLDWTPWITLLNYPWANSSVDEIHAQLAQQHAGNAWARHQQQQQADETWMTEQKHMLSSFKYPGQFKHMHEFNKANTCPSVRHIQTVANGWSQATRGYWYQYLAKYRYVARQVCVIWMLMNT